MNTTKANNKFMAHWARACQVQSTPSLTVHSCIVLNRQGARGSGLEKVTHHARAWYNAIFAPSDFLLGCLRSGLPGGGGGGGGWGGVK